MKGGQVMETVREILREGRSVGEEDPRRIIHAFKVGLALVLVFSFYYYNPLPDLPDYFGINAMWAVMTVAVVFEFSVGATLGKGLNRGVATLVAGGLGVGARQLASLSGRIVQPILLSIFVFVLAGLFTFMRFFPRLKARYDYCLSIFILTFALISLSGFENEEILDLAQSRLSTVMVGGATCVLISIFVCPVWAGQDLHSLLASNVDTLACFLQDFGDEYFEEDGDIREVEERRKNMARYKSVLDSKSSEETLANFAKWEPRHGKFRYWHPWEQYLAVGALLRQCACRIDALNSYISSEFQIPMDVKKKLEEPLRRISSESGESMKEVSILLKKMAKSSSSNICVSNSKSACKALLTSLKSGILNDVEPLQTISLMTTVSLLIDIVNLTGKISDSVYKLASTAKFKTMVVENKLDSRSIGRDMPKKLYEYHDDDDDDDDDDDVGKSRGDSLLDSCHHVTIKIVDDDSVHDAGGKHVHTSVSSD